MSDLLIGLLSALISTNPPTAVSNLVHEKTGASVEFVSPNDPVEKEYLRIMTDDDAAQTEADKWIAESRSFTNAAVDSPKTTLTARINQRFDQVKKEYEDFLFSHPNHARAHLAYGSFLNDRQDPDGAIKQWEKARELDPKNPAAWNNLANEYAHHSPITKAFDYYEKAIELNPKESTYYYNFATTVYVFRTDAREHYHITDDQVFDKALDLYHTAVKLDPNNFVLASDYAQSFYGTKPPRWADGLVAWEGALKLAHDEIEREGVYIHMARIKWHLGRLSEARDNLAAVTNEMYLTVKKTLDRNINEAIKKASASTNSPVN